MLVSVIIRTLNEEKHLDELLFAVNAQKSDIFSIETIVVDSGSTDSTLQIVERHHANLIHIKKEDFSFGRSLNIGCNEAKGKILIFISGHCIPTCEQWLHRLCFPIYDQKVQYTYGSQQGRHTTKYSEEQVFSKYFPAESMIPQEGYFCNNANAALLKSSWEELQFDENLTGLEDMYLAKRLIETGGLVGYIQTASVYHIHDDVGPQIKRRYEREAIALRYITPEIHMTIKDTLHCFMSSVISDMKSALMDKVILRETVNIIAFRFLQYWGAYKGNHVHRKLSYEAKRKYFYPNERVTKRLKISENE